MSSVPQKSSLATSAMAYGLCLASLGQAQPVNPVTPLIPETALTAATSLAPDSNRTILTVQNKRNSALTALVYSAQADVPISTGGTSPVGVLAYRDPAINATYRPIPANQTAFIKISLAAPAKSVSVKAALWADGTSFGDPKYLHTLLHQRGLLKEHLASAMSILSAAQAQGTALPAVIESVNAASAKLDQGDSVDEKYSVTVAEEMVKRAVADRETIGDLMRKMQLLVDRLAPYVTANN